MIGQNDKIDAKQKMTQDCNKNLCLYSCKTSPCGYLSIYISEL